MFFNLHHYPNEYTVIYGNQKLRMVLQRDYAELRSAYFELLEKLDHLAWELEEKKNGV